jgi:hypothetical protein
MTMSAKYSTSAAPTSIRYVFFGTFGCLVLLFTAGIKEVLEEEHITEGSCGTKDVESPPPGMRLLDMRILYARLAELPRVEFKQKEGVQVDVTHLVFSSFFISSHLNFAQLRPSSEPFFSTGVFQILSADSGAISHSD